MIQNIQQKIKYYQFGLCLFGALLVYPATGRCVSRSMGLGYRTSFWNISNHPTRFFISNNGQDASFEIGGVGPSFYLFSRAYQNIFCEMNFMTLVSVRGKQTNYIVEEAEATGLVSLGLGLRYDIFATRLPTVMKPYLSVGVEKYRISSGVATNDEFTIQLEMLENTAPKTGLYWGGGMNLMFTSWFALNFDYRYHFVDYKFREKPSGIAFSFGLCFMFGRKRDIFRIQEVKQVVKDIYPAFFQFYRTYPLAYVKVRNMVTYPIEVNVKSYIRGYTERIYESGFVPIGKGKIEDIPIRAFLGSQLMETANPKPAVLNVQVEGRAGTRESKSLSTKIVIHHRNAWDGDIQRLIYFVTPENERILAISRRVVSQILAQQIEVNNFTVASALFQELQQLRIRYFANPQIPFYLDQKVKFAAETIDVGSGDCDDLVVLYSSLLESAGIKTAFVEVQKPDSSQKQLYLLFDTEVPPEEGAQISTNEKRYIIRENKLAHRTLWIPIVLSQLNNDFETAWKAGAMNYLRDAVLENGLEMGWVKVVAVE